MTGELRHGSRSCREQDRLDVVDGTMAVTLPAMRSTIRPVRHFPMAPQTRQECPGVGDRTAMAGQEHPVVGASSSRRARPCSRPSRRRAARRSRSTRPSRDRPKTGRRFPPARKRRDWRHGRASAPCGSPSHRPSTDAAVGKRDIGHEFRVGAGVERIDLADLQRPGRAVRALGADDSAGRSFSLAASGEWSRCVWLTKMWLTGRPPMAAEQRRRCASSSGPGIDHRQRLAPDEIAVGAVKGERPGIVGRDALDAGRNRRRLAVGGFEARVEFEGHGNVAEAPLRERQNRLPHNTEANIRKTDGRSQPAYNGMGKIMAIAIDDAPACFSRPAEKGAARLATQLVPGDRWNAAADLVGQDQSCAWTGRHVDADVGRSADRRGFGMRLGVATLLLYMAQGAMGFPVFQGTPEKGIGIAYMLGSTGGYLPASWSWRRSSAGPPTVAGTAIRSSSSPPCLSREIVMMAMGFAWLALLIGAEKSWQFGVLPFIVGDLIKVALAASLVPAVWSLLPKHR